VCAVVADIRRHGNPGSHYPSDARDFPETFTRVGWEGIEWECRAHKTTIKRWMLDYGEEALIDARRAYLVAQYAARGVRPAGIRPGRKLGISARYVMGRTRCPKAVPPAVPATAAELSATLADLAPEDMA
jgi:hypothetical protein